MGNRWFIALIPPSPLQEEITALKTDICERFQSCAALKSPPHITLQPPFEHPLDQLDQLHPLLLDFAQQIAPFGVELDGFGAFPPRVIYIVIASNPNLMTLQHRLRQDLQAAFGIQGDRRPFCPHLTVAFRDLQPSSFQQAWPEFQQRPFHTTFLAPALTLLHSIDGYWQVAATCPMRSQTLGR